MNEMRHFRKAEASSLLFAFFVMSALLLSVLGVNAIILRDIRSVDALLSGAASEYAAEGMTELGLLSVKSNLPGYEAKIADHIFTSGALGTLKVLARDSVLPCFEDGKVWRKLSSGESLQLPLFAQTGESAKETAKTLSFYVEFYIGNEEDQGVAVRGDVLRWKILGLSRSGITEAISEFLPLDLNKFTALLPSVFGSYTEAVPERYSSAKFTSNEGGRFAFYPFYPIRTFLEEHDYNYLVLTNVMQVEDLSIYFKLHSVDQKPVCEFVTLESSGKTEGVTRVRQSLKTQVREGENLPVFDYVLYHTKP